jgi:hypothetical protein
MREWEANVAQYHPGDIGTESAVAAVGEFGVGGRSAATPACPAIAPIHQR